MVSKNISTADKTENAFAIEKVKPNSSVDMNENVVEKWRRIKIISMRRYYWVLEIGSWWEPGPFLLILLMSPPLRSDLGGFSEE